MRNIFCFLFILSFIPFFTFAAPPELKGTCVQILNKGKLEYSIPDAVKALFAKRTETRNIHIGAYQDFKTLELIGALAYLRDLPSQEVGRKWVQLAQQFEKDMYVSDMVAYHRARGGGLISIKEVVAAFSLAIVYNQEPLKTYNDLRDLHTNKLRTYNVALAFRLMKFSLVYGIPIVDVFRDWTDLCRFIETQMNMGSTPMALNPLDALVGDFPFSRAKDRIYALDALEASYVLGRVDVSRKFKRLYNRVLKHPLTASLSFQEQAAIIQYALVKNKTIGRSAERWHKFVSEWNQAVGREMPAEFKLFALQMAFRFEVEPKDYTGILLYLFKEHAQLSPTDAVRIVNRALVVLGITPFERAAGLNGYEGRPSWIR